jgi:hypothetical protein
MDTHATYLDELLHDAWIPLPPVEVGESVVLQCHRDADGKRSYFRVTLVGSAIAGFEDPEQRGAMTVLGVATADTHLCFEGVEGGELRLRSPAAIRHASAGTVEDTRSWTAKIGLGEGEPPPTAVEVVPLDHTTE